MSTEEVKYKQQLTPLSGANKPAASAETQTKKIDANLIAEAFKKFAQQNGISLTTESFLGIINSHPEILNLPADKQASELLKLFNNDKPSENQPQQTTAAEQTSAQPQAQPAASTAPQTSTPASAQANPFGAAIAENELFTEVLGRIESEQNTQVAQNLFSSISSDSIKNFVLSNVSLVNTINHNEEEAELSTNPQDDESAESELAESAKDTELGKADRMAQRMQARADKSHSKAGKGFFDFVANTIANANKGVRSLNKKYKNIQQRAAEQENQNSLSKSIAKGYSSLAFSNMTDKEKTQEYTESLAQNLFMNGNPKRTLEEWNNLAKADKEAYIKQAESKKQILVENTTKALEDLAKLLQYTPQNDTKNTAIEFQMTLLQTANYEGLSVEEFIQKPLREQLALIANYLDTGKNTGEKSALDKLIIDKSQFLKDAFSYSLQQTGTIQQGQSITFREMYMLAHNDGDNNDKNNLSTGRILVTYLEHLKEIDKITPQQEELLNQLNSIGVKHIDNFGTNRDIELTIEKEIVNDPKKYKDYKNASPAQKQEKLIDYFFEQAVDTTTHTINVQKFATLIDECIIAGENKISFLFAVIDRLEEMCKDPVTKKIKPELMPDNKEEFIKMCEEKGYTLVLTHLSGLFKDTKFSSDVATSLARQCDANDPEDVDKYQDGMKELARSGIRYNNHGQLIETVSASAGSKIDAGTEFGQIAGQGLIQFEDRYTDEEKERITADIHGSENHSAKYGIQKESSRVDTDFSNRLTDAATKDDAEVARFNTENGDYGQMTEANQRIAAKNGQESLEKATQENPDKYKDVYVQFTNQIPDWYAETQAEVHEQVAKSSCSEVAEAAAANIYKYDKSVQEKALQATLQSGNQNAIETAASNISKMDKSVQSNAIKATFATNNTKAIEIVLLQVQQMDSSVIASIQSEIDAQVAIMEEKHVQSIIDAFARRQVNKEFGMNVDNNSQQFQSRLERYMAELKGMTTAEIYQKLCSDIQYWATDMQSAALERIAKYCPHLFNMMLEKYGVKLLTSFGQINVATKNEILLKMLKDSGSRAEAMEYLKSNPDGAYSDTVKELYNKLLAEKTGDDYDKAKAQRKETEVSHQSEPMSFGSQTGSTRTNLHAEDSYWKTRANLNYYMA